MWKKSISLSNLEQAQDASRSVDSLLEKAPIAQQSKEQLKSDLAVIFQFAETQYGMAGVNRRFRTSRSLVGSDYDVRVMVNSSGPGLLDRLRALLIPTKGQ